MTANHAPTNQELLNLYRQMALIRGIEERLRDDNAAGKLPGGVHLYIGQEAVAAGVCAHLTDRDYITSTHRGHGHFLAKGGDPRAMMAEVWGKREGICHGMGGSMHVADVARGILGANGIVGAGLAIATGAALAAQLDGDGKVAVCFFGDGAAHQGVVMECMNIASVWRLPMLFLCENNRYSEFTPSSQITAGKLGDRARAAAIPATEVDGNDVSAVWRAAGDAIERARQGEGPSFVEAHTYRIQGHLEAEALFLQGQRYREQEEIDAWKEKCPLIVTRSQIIARGAGDESVLSKIDTEVAELVDDAAAFAEAGTPADVDLPAQLMFT